MNTLPEPNLDDAQTRLNHVQALFAAYNPDARLIRKTNLRELQMRLFDIARLLDDHAPSLARELALQTSRELRVKWNL